MLASTVTLNFAAGHNHAEGMEESGAVGKPGKAVNAKRTIAVNMTDAMRFIPNSIMVKQGETIKFIVKTLAS